MPIFEYECRSCGDRFEAIVRPPAEALCPSCHGSDLEKLISLFAVNSEGSRKLAMNAIRRDNARVTRDKAWADHDYDKKHRHDPD